ncbi:MAG: metallophosphoesterase [Gammaproteobacteria bacterium]
MAFEPWEHSDRKAYGANSVDPSELRHHLRRGLAAPRALWPLRKVFFLSDLHADHQAFLQSLESAGAIRRKGDGPQAFTLTSEGRAGLTIIGGDCLDKGPSNLDLLAAIHHFMALGGTLTILAGNHDLRLLLGLRAFANPNDIRSRHFFLRMGAKVVPLLAEVHARFAKEPGYHDAVPGAAECRRALFPTADWFEAFPRWAGAVMSADNLARERARLGEKQGEFEAAAVNAGMDIRALWAATRRCHRLFVPEDAPLRWFFDCMELSHQEGSFLFVHAGVDDQVARLIEEQGITGLNTRFWNELGQDPIAVYFGPLANVLRTKYRDTDHPLTAKGVDALHRAGIHAVVHGHQSRVAGQRMALREGLLHVECDITLNCHSRARKGMVGQGAGATIICPERQIIGISTDYPRAKVFDPLALLDAPALPC